MNEDVVQRVGYIAMPFGLVRQWLSDQRWRMQDSSLETRLATGLDDWDGRYELLHWLTERVVDDHNAASATPRDFRRDVSLANHLTFWFITARFCYDTIGYIAAQMADKRDCGKLPSLSFNDLCRHHARKSYSERTKAMLEIVRSAKEVFEEVKTIRDRLVHFIGQAGGEIKAPMRIYIDIPNQEGVQFIVERSRFADMHGPIRKWPMGETLSKHFRAIYESAARLECCFLDHVAAERLPGVYHYMSRRMFEFLGSDAFNDCSHQKWAVPDSAERGATDSPKSQT